MKLQETLKRIKRIRREITDERDISAIVVADKNGVIVNYIKGALTKGE